jgi:hypothetical protein
MSGSAFARSVDVFLSRELSPQAMSAALAKAADEGTAELIRTRRASPRFKRFVDGVEGAAAGSVKPGGIIVDQFIYLGDAAAFALAYLQGRSPVLSGDFRGSFVLGLSSAVGGDGKFVKATSFNPDAVSADVVEIIIGNTQPYNRLVDVQLEGGRRARFKVPADIYSDAAKAITRRFGNFVNAFRRYDVRFPGQYVLRGSRRGGKPVQSPALVIQVRG